MLPGSNSENMVSLVENDTPRHALWAPDADLSLDQFKALLVVEASYAVPHIPCRGPAHGVERVPYGEWRRKISQWSFKVIDHFHLDREVVSCALNIFDRYLAAKSKSHEMDSCPCPACRRSIDSRCFQLTAMTSLYLAMKVNSESSDDAYSLSRRLRLNSFVELSRGQFCSADIVAMEQQILKELRWKVHPPTPMTAVSYLLRLMPEPSCVPYKCRKSFDLVLHVLHELARYLTELSVCLGSTCTRYSPSQVAYAAILVSMDVLTESALPNSVRDAFNSAVVAISTSTRGTILTPHDEPIRILQEQLRKSFWPEMLMDDCEGAEGGHPISMARDYGLLDISSISHSPTYPKTSTPKNWEYSPVCVSRGGSVNQFSSC